VDGSAWIGIIAGRSNRWTTKPQRELENKSTTLRESGIKFIETTSFMQWRRKHRGACFLAPSSQPSDRNVRLGSSTDLAAPNSTSALPPKATQVGHRAMSVWCQKRKSSVFPIRSPPPGWARSHSGRPASRNESIILSTNLHPAYGRADAPSG